MKLSGLRPFRAIATLTLSIGLLGLGSPAAQAVPSFWYPSGIQTNVAASTITSNGWTLCWSGTYADSANKSDVLAACDQTYVMLVGGAAGSSSYMLAAAGERSSVFSFTSTNYTTFNNGTYFYYNDASMGFAPNSSIQQSSADTYDSSGGTADYRLSWHTGYASINGGWRVGAITGLNSSTSYVRAIYESNGVATPNIGTQPQSQSKTAGENVTFTVAATSPDGGTISYQWQKYIGSTWTDISGATDASYSIYGLLVSEAGSYRANVTNAWGGHSSTTSSSTAVLSVSKLTPTAMSITTTSATYGTALSLESTGGASNASSVVFTVTTSGSAGCSITGSSLTSSASGTCGVTATKAADATYLAATSGEVTISIAKAAQATLTLASDTATYGSPVTLLATGGTGAGAVTYAVVDGGTAGCSINGSTLSSLSSGTCSLTATRATDTRYLATTSAIATYTIVKAAQSSLSIITTLGVYGSSLTLGTAGGSGTGAITYSVSSSGTAGCVESAGSLTPTHAGACTITATKAADGAYTSRTSSITTITFVKAAQTAISITTTSGVFGTPLTLATSGGTGAGTLLFAVTAAGTAQCAMAGSVVTAGHAGTCTVTVAKTSDGDYEASSSEAVITFAKAGQASLVVSTVSGTFGDALTLATSGGSGSGAVSYSLVATGSALCSLNAGVLTSGHAGTCTITATKAADGDYLVNTTENTTITFAKAAQGSLAIATTAGTYAETLTMATSGGSGSGAVSYSLVATGSALCSLNAGVLTPGHAGTCTVTATKAADGDYLVNTTENTIITFAKANQATLVISTVSGTYDSDLTLATTGGSGTGAASYSLVAAGSALCSLNAGVLTSGHAGTCTITATKAADGNYLVNTTENTTITFAKANQATLVVSTVSGTYGDELTLATSGGSGSGAVSYSLVATGSALCSLNAGVLTAGHAGSCTVTATKAADGNYLVNTPENSIITFAKAAQGSLAITTTAGTYGDALTLATTGGSGSGAVSYSLVATGSALCSLNAGVLTPGHAGTCTVTATKAADGDYLVNTTENTIITFAKAEQGSLAITTTAGTYGETLTLATTGGTGTGAVTHAIVDSGSAACTIAGSHLIAGSAGSCDVVATKASDDDYLARSSSVTTITIAKAEQLPLQVVAQSTSFGEHIHLSTSGGSGDGAVSYALSGASIGCQVNGDVLSASGVATCLVIATKATDVRYLSVDSAVKALDFGPRLVVIYAPSASIEIGQRVDTATTSLGLLTGDSIANVVLSYQGTTIRGDAFGPSSVAPTEAGTYTVRLSEFHISGPNSNNYTVATRAGVLNIRWADLPINDPALIGLHDGESRTAGVETTTPTFTYSADGASASGNNWLLTIRDATSSLAGDRLIFVPGRTFILHGTGYRPFSAVRIYVLSTPLELGSVWTDALGNFTTTVNAPAGLPLGSHQIQVNGYASVNVVRSVMLAAEARASSSLRLGTLFRGKSIVAPASNPATVVRSISALPANIKTVEVTVVATAQRGKQASRALAVKRARAMAATIQVALRAKAINNSLRVTVRTAVTATPRILRLVQATIRW